MANQRKSEARQIRITQYATSRKMAKTWGLLWRMLNTPLGEKVPNLTPPQIQGKKTVVKKEKAA